MDPDEVRAMAASLMELTRALGIETTPAYMLFEEADKVEPVS
jgi:hypothetical protein